MAVNLVIVESPAKAKTIENFLGKDFMVKSSFGHIRDLARKNFGIEIENEYQPQYIIPEDKKKVVDDLKKAAAKAETVWLASDEDREGEAIAWHLYRVLELKPEKVRRIVFHEITKEAIMKAIANPRPINMELVNAQQARRVLDRLVGFELSPVLWKKVKPSLSAGRVQSVAVRLLVEREREILAFKSSSSYRITALFDAGNGDTERSQFQAELSKRFPDRKKALEFLKKCAGAQFLITNITTKPAKKSPPPPFTTSTLQQEASRKLGFSVTQTMSLAQRLYEAGKITYMRTDSLNLSDSAISAAAGHIKSEYGEKYLRIRKYKTKSKGAQEAHEAIRPTYLKNITAGNNTGEQRLYELIRKRTIASQMSDALLEKTNVTISISNAEENFFAFGEVLRFDGFIRVYTEGVDDENEENGKGLLPPLKKDDKPDALNITATERFTQHPPRYTEASLVKKLEELGIGRPSTYAPTISNIQNRGYVVREDRPGTERKYTVIELDRHDNISERSQTEISGREKAKLFPNDIGMVVNDFLLDHFNDILDYNFTASVEKEFDDIAEGKLSWPDMIDKFYRPFHKKVEETIETTERNKGERLLGADPGSGKNVYVKIGRFGPMAQIGDSNDQEKPKFAALRREQRLETISLSEALDLFILPRKLGMYEDREVVSGIGRFGPYIRHDNKFVSLKKDIDNPYTIELERAIELIEEKRRAEREKIIRVFDKPEGLSILNGRWGPYISYGKKNYRIPKNIDPAALTGDECMEIIKKQQEKTGKNKPAGKSTRKAASKKKRTQ
ncbi:MAG: type I DNA topoisomerase [Bacteroidales bacterium]